MLGGGGPTGTGAGAGAGIAFHCAYKVKSEVCPCEYGNEIALPPEEEVNQPAKV